MKNTRRRKIFSGAILVSCWLLWAVSAQDEAPTESAPPPSDAIDKHPAELQTDAQSKALAQALYSIALRREMKESFDAALPQYLNVLKVDPHFVDLQVRIAFYYLHEHDSGEALDLLTKAAEANPQSGEVQAAIAFVQETSNHLDLALASALKALSFEPDNVLAHRVRFQSLCDLSRPAEALAAAKELPQLHCKTAKIWVELARSYTELICASTNLSKEDLANLITPLYDKAFSMGDPTAELLSQRADFVSFLGKKEEALKYFEEASQKGEPSAELYVRVAHLHSEMGHGPEAIKNYEEAYTLSPDMPQLREELSYQYILNGQEDKAIVLLEAILRKSPTRAGVYSKLGDLYRQAKQYDKSEVNYRQSIALDPANVFDYLKLAMVYLSQKRLSDAANLLTDARSHFPSNARVAFYAAIVQREMKNSQQALDLFAQAKLLADEAEEKDKEFPYAEYFCELSLAQEEAGKTQQSEATLKEGLSRDPNDENLLNALAYLWAEQGKNLPEALKFSKRSLQISPDRPEFVDTLAWVYFKMGKFQDALPLLEKAVSSIDGEEEVLDHLAEVYWKLGQTKEALAALDKILVKNPDNSAIREKYEKIKKGSPLASTPPIPARD